MSGLLLFMLVVCGVGGLTFLSLVGRYKHMEEKLVQRRADILARIAEQQKVDEQVQVAEPEHREIPVAAVEAA